MPTGPRRVRDYAAEVGLEIDQALVTLWDAGLVQVNGPESVIPKRHLALVERALNLPSRAELQTATYWQDHLQMNRGELESTLRQMGLHLSPSARKVPKNAIRKLRHLLPPVPVPAQSAAEAGGTEPPLVWETIGRECDLHPIVRDDVVAIHSLLEQDFANSPDPIEPRGVRDEALLDSALARPFTAFGDRRKYPSLPMAASALFHSLIHNHPFHNGNKRTALVTLLVYLDRHGDVLDCSQTDLFKQTLLTAQHRVVDRSWHELPDREVLENARWINVHSRHLDRSERPMKWLRLKQRLRTFDCQWTPAPGGGTAVNIERHINVNYSRWGRVRPTTEVLRVQVRCPGDGADASPQTIRTIRHALRLDNDHGVDSASFYRGDSIDVFVAEYRQVLRRLARL